MIKIKTTVVTVALTERKIIDKTNESVLNKYLRILNLLSVTARTQMKQ